MAPANKLIAKCNLNLLFTAFYILLINCFGVYKVANRHSHEWSLHLQGGRRRQLLNMLAIVQYYDVSVFYLQPTQLSRCAEQ